jgi:galactokinase/mevalonate kinase-like predicted kinase
MPPSSRPIDYLISVPIAMSRSFTGLYPNSFRDWFVASDPPGSQLGSAGGTVYLLVEAWKNSGHGGKFVDWLHSSKKLIVHGGGRSRRLPAYAPTGKPFIPIPITRSGYGERLDQKLIDINGERYEKLFDNAPARYGVMVTSGDVILDFDYPENILPIADVLCFGMKVDAEIAQDFGVFVTDRDGSGNLLTMLQKPTAEQIRVASEDRAFLVDTGMWLLSDRAVMAILAKCGWDDASQTFSGDVPANYDLYGQFGLALGENPSTRDPDITVLSSSVYALQRPSFLHLGSSRQLIESVSSMQASAANKLNTSSAFRHPDIYIQNSHFDPPTNRSANTMLWIENSCIPSSWQVIREHVLTGIPLNNWSVKLEPGVCVDFVPFGDEKFAVRVYGFDDPWAGAIGSDKTVWFDRPAAKWFADRNIDPLDCSIPFETDIHEALLHPVLTLDEIDGGFLQWIFRSVPQPNAEHRSKWISAHRLSSQHLNKQANVARQMASRMKNLRDIVPLLQSNAHNSVFYRVDLAATALLLSDNGDSPEPTPLPSATEDRDNPLLRSKAAMYQSALLRHGNRWTNAGEADPGAEMQAEAFSYMRSLLMSDPTLPVTPVLDIQEDQIVWGRSPIRFDIAGGWLDTPPYCLEHGGRVINIAVDLNGQPPIHVYAKLSNNYEIVVRSIDLGVEQRLRTYDDLASYAQPGSEFALAKAALALSGFLPEYQKSNGFISLEEQLKAFGAGIEISMMVAIPAGSGLGTSSILAATLLGTLSNLCRLHWSRADIVRRALVLEQMLTTGGGWQDQVGGVYGGLKLAETVPGMHQDPVVRWLPDTLFSSGANTKILLYYTGITRMAKNILQDIARDMFLNRADTLACLRDMDVNVDRAVNAIQLGDYPGLMRATQLTWEFAQRLAAETNPLSVKGAFECLAGEEVVGRFLGAGGGGYLLLLCADDSTGTRVREKLLANPLNPRARFVDISTSQVGLAVTRS